MPILGKSLLILAFILFNQLSWTAASERTVIGFFPGNVSYPSSQQWLGVFLQEALSFQIRKNETHWVADPTLLDLWTRHQGVPFTESDFEEMLEQSRLPQGVFMTLQQVLNRVAITLHYVRVPEDSTSSKVQITRHQSTHEFITPDALVLQILKILDSLLFKESELTFHPQFYDWEAVETFYRWKQQPPPTPDSASWVVYQQQLEEFLISYPEITDWIYPQLANLYLYEAVYRQPANQTLLEKAAFLAKKSVESDPENAEHHVLLGSVYYFQQKPHLAKSESVIANAKNPHGGMSHMLYGLSVSQQSTEQYRYFQMGWSNDPFLIPPLRADVPLLYSVIAPLLPKPEDTLSAQVTPVVAASDDVEDVAVKEVKSGETVAVLLDRLKAVIKKSDWGQAETLLLQLKLQAPDLPEVMFHEGWVLENQKNYVDAEKSYRAALEKNPNFPNAMLRLGTVLFKQGNVAEAQSFLENLTQKYPSLHIAWWNLGLLYWQQNDVPRTQAAWSKALEADPQNKKYQKYLKSLQGLVP